MRALDALKQVRALPTEDEDLDLSQAFEDPFNKPCSVWLESRVPRLAEENVALSLLSSVGWMPKNID